MVRLCLERENILELVGAKLVWRIANLEMAAGAGQERMEIFVTRWGISSSI